MVSQWRCMRSKRCVLSIAALATFVITYFLLRQDDVLDHDITKSFIYTPMLNTSKPLKRPIGNTTILKTHAPNILLRYVDSGIEEALKEDKGTGCDVPDLDPFSPEMTKFDKDKKQPDCKGEDWVTCELDWCRLKVPLTDVRCAYRDVMFHTDFSQLLGTPVSLPGHAGYGLRESDYVDVECTGTDAAGTSKKWSGLVWGHRRVKHTAPPGRENTPSILILAFDSTSRNGFMRRLPRSYKVLTEELGAIVLNRYNIVGDGTPAALFPILTGLTELELPEVRRRSGSGLHMDDFPFIWNALREDGYVTSYGEDSPGVGTFQYRFNGFSRQPTDHYLRPFLQQYHSERRRYGHYTWYCIGDAPSHALMMNKTRQLMRAPGKKFVFTFVADISHDDFNLISNAEDTLVKWLRGLLHDGSLDNTVLIVMGDHGSRFADFRNTFQGKLEERLPLMAIRLPHSLAHESLRANADVLTTPFDIHNTLWDAAGLPERRQTKAVRGADYPRSMSLLRPIPANRSCSEAGVEAHWCTCLKWTALDESDVMYQRAVAAFVDFVNDLTAEFRNKCVMRTLTSVDSVGKRDVNQNLLKFNHAKDLDGYIGNFDGHTRSAKQYYQVKLTLAPGVGVYEASLTYDVTADRFSISPRDVSRISAYGHEPDCISKESPHLNMYCYCAT